LEKLVEMKKPIVPNSAKNGQRQVKEMELKLANNILDTNFYSRRVKLNL